MTKKKAAAPRKVGVIIANTGTPEAPTRKAVKKYLSSVPHGSAHLPHAAPRVVDAFAHPYSGQALAGLGGEVREDLDEEEGSPLIAITTSLESGLNEYYADRGLPVMVRAGMGYGKPQIKRVVKELKRGRLRRSWWCCPCTRSRPSPLPAR